MALTGSGGCWAGLRVALLTLDQGRDIYELEGHSELRFVDPDRDIDMSVSWGVFDFDSPGFVYRFVKGDTDYIAASRPYMDFLAINRYYGRRVTCQWLDLDSIEAERMLAIAEWNLLPENRVYRYNYVKDNCATRPLALIRQGIGEDLVHQRRDSLAGTTWREEMTRYHAGYPWYQFGIDLALGSGIDKPLTVLEQCYAPVFMGRYLQEATRADGRPIVSGGPVTVLEGTPEGRPEEATPWYLTPMAVACMSLFLTSLVAYRDLRRRRRPSKWLYTTLYGLGTVAGVVLTFLIFVSTHEATSPNWLYLWLNPLCLAGVVGVWLKKYNRAIYFYQIVNFVALMSLVAIGIAGIQHLNSADYPLVMCYMITAGEYIYLYRCHKKSTNLSRAV